MNFVAFSAKPIFKAAVTTKVVVNAVESQIHGLVVVNQTAAEAFLQVFDKLTANVTLGTTVPDWVVPIPASGGVVIPINNIGIPHLIGIVIAGTTTPTGNTGAALDVTLFVK